MNWMFYLKTTETCQLNCKHCFTSGINGKKIYFDPFKTIDFVADRYIIDIIDGEIEDKYLAFPQPGEKLP
jgi:MoaA/NifB/PqqE/SkfB family radical SAM enzyme